MIGRAVRRFGCNGKHRGFLWLVAVLHMVWGKWALRFIFTNAIRVFTRMAKRTLVQIAGPGAAYIQHDQAHSASYCCVSAISRTEGIGATVHAKLAGNRAVDNNQRRGYM